MNIFNIILPPVYGKFLNKHFEKVSVIYHIFFITFLGYLIFFRTPDVHVPDLFIRFLGCYVILYGITILLFGPRLMNRLKVY